ncbi:AAA family ATPase, partial [Aeromonas veronii]|nr:AAA family ATPase [Aeromonas veronii]
MMRKGKIPFNKPKVNICNIMILKGGDTMLIAELHLSNFRSFGEELQIVKINDLTALIGANSSGKTSLIVALLRMFGQKNIDRTLVKTDFHIPSNVDISTVNEMNLLVEVKVIFPELEWQSPTEIETIPEFIKHLVIEETGKAPYLRIRLVGKWIKGSSPDGDIEQE